MQEINFEQVYALLLQEQEFSSLTRERFHQMSQLNWGGLYDTEGNTVGAVLTSKYMNAETLSDATDRNTFAGLKGPFVVLSMLVVAPGLRKRGNGLHLVRTTIANWRNLESPPSAFAAEIARGNMASIKLFRSLGFAPHRKASADEWSWILPGQPGTFWILQRFWREVRYLCRGFS